MFEHDGRNCGCCACDTNRERLRSARPPKAAELRPLRCTKCRELIGMMSALVVEKPIVYCTSCGLGPSEEQGGTYGG